MTEKRAHADLAFKSYSDFKPAEVDGVYFGDWFLSRKYLAHLYRWLKYKLQLKEIE